MDRSDAALALELLRRHPEKIAPILKIAGFTCGPPQGAVWRRLTVQESHPLRTELAPVSPWAACPLAQSTRTCRESQSARHSPLIPWEDRSRSQKEEHCPAQTPTSRCSSRPHRRQSRFDSGSMHHLVRPVPVGEILVSIRAVHQDPPTTPLPERPSPLATLQRPPGSSRCKPIGRLLHIVENAIHRLRYTVRCVACHVFAECT